MKKSQERVSELRRIVALGREHGQGGYPAEVKRQVMGYARERFKQGSTTTSVAQELGLNRHTLAQWRRDVSKTTPTTRPAMRAVSVVREPVHKQSSELVLQGPGGLRVEGLTLNQVVELLRALR